MSTFIVNWYTILTQNVIAYTTRLIQAVGDVICWMKMLVVQSFSKSYVHLAMLNWLLFLLMTLRDTISSKYYIWYNYIHSIAKLPCVVIAPIPCFVEGTKTIQKSKPNTVENMQPQCTNLDITGLCSKWNCTDWFLRHSFPVWPPAVGIRHNQLWLINSPIINIQCVNVQKYGI